MEIYMIRCHRCGVQEQAPPPPQIPDGWSLYQINRPVCPDCLDALILEKEQLTREAQGLNLLISGRPRIDARLAEVTERLAAIHDEIREIKEVTQ